MATQVHSTTASDAHPATCPAANLASQAAHLIRLLQAGEDDEASPLSAVLDVHNGPSRKYVLSQLRDRLRAVEAQAVHARATSAKGALFQIYLAGSVAYAIPDVFDAIHGSSQLRGWEDAEHDAQLATSRVWRLTRSASAVLEAEADDDDLRAIRSWHMELETEVDAVLEKLGVA